MKNGMNEASHERFSLLVEYASGVVTAGSRFLRKEQEIDHVQLEQMLGMLIGVTEEMGDRGDLSIRELSAHALNSWAMLLPHTSHQGCQQ
jgi:hypothetical protein